MRKLQSLDLAEEALQEAALKALAKWPEQGVPDNVTAWLVRVALNSTIDNWRRERRLQSLDASFDTQSSIAYSNSGHKDAILSPSSGDPAVLPASNSSTSDDVLNLIFLCAHPAIAVENQLAMVLKMVMGFSQTEVAKALLISEKTLEQRLTRAKRKIRDSGISFDLSPNANLSERQNAVMQSLYLIFNEGYSSNGGAQLLNRQLCHQAINMMRVLCRQFPEPECLGLLSLMLFQSAREEARLDKSGVLVTLDKQQRALWDKAKIREADVLIQKALRRGKPGAYQLQAAIAAVHSQALTAQDTDWLQIVGLYGRLIQVQPSPVVRLNHAVAVMFAGDVAAAASLLVELAAPLENYSSFHAALARVHALNREPEKAAHALQRAAALAGSEQERSHYLVQLAELLGD